MVEFRTTVFEPLVGLEEVAERLDLSLKQVEQIFEERILWVDFYNGEPKISLLLLNRKIREGFQLPLPIHNP